MMEMQPDVAVDRDYCLRRLIGQAEGRKVDVNTDRYLIEQINDAHIADIEAGNVTECQMGGCALLCVTTNEKGILRLVAEVGEAVCD